MQHAFPIEISPEKVIGGLKKAIVVKNPNHFRGIVPIPSRFGRKLSLKRTEIS